MSRLILILGLISSAWAQSSPAAGPLYTLSTIAGGAPPLEVFYPHSLAFDGAGNLYVGGYSAGVLRIAPGGSMTVVPGTGALEVAADPSGTIYLVNYSKNQVLRLKPDGTLSTFAGTGQLGSSGDGGPATSAQLYGPIALAFDRAGNVYIGQGYDGRIRKVTPDGNISTVAGDPNGTIVDGGPAISARFFIQGLAVDVAGNLYIADSEAHRVRAVGLDGKTHTVAGGGDSEPAEGVPATSARLSSPNAVLVDAAGNLYFSDSDGHQVFRVSPDGIMHKVAGTGTGGYLLSRSRDAVLSQLNRPTGLALDAAGNIYVADYGNMAVRKIDSQGKISLFAGTPVGDGGLAANAALGSPRSIALDLQNNAIYLTDSFFHIRKIDRNGVITTVAGNGEQGFIADGVPATTAPLNSPTQIAVGPSGDLYIADTGNHRVRKVDSIGVISTVAGSDSAGFSGDGGPADAALLSSPSGVAVDQAGAIYIADTGNHRIRKITADGTISTLAGDGKPGFTTDQVSSPGALAVDFVGNVYAVDAGNYAIRKITPDGAITTVAGTGAPGMSSDGGLAVFASLYHPVAVALDSAGDIFIADTRVRRVRPDGVIDTVAGFAQIAKCESMPQDADPDGLPAFLQPVWPCGIAAAGTGNLYIAAYGQIKKATVLRNNSGPPTLLTHAVVNAPNLTPAPVSPGELITLFGTDIGPAEETTATPDASGQYPTALAGVRVLFNGVEAPVFYAQAYTVKTVVPSSTALGATLDVRVEYNGKQSNPATVPIAEAAPAIITVETPSPRGGQAAALNEDGTLNSPDNPATPGSIVTFYFTGAGAMQPAISDGQLAMNTGATPRLPVSVWLYDTPAEVLYAGPAVGIVSNVLQINARLPKQVCLVSYLSCHDVGFPPPNPSTFPLSVILGEPDSSGNPGKYRGLPATIAVTPSILGPFAGQQ